MLSSSLSLILSSSQSLIFRPEKSVEISQRLVSDCGCGGPGVDPAQVRARRGSDAELPFLDDEVHEVPGCQEHQRFAVELVLGHPWLPIRSNNRRGVYTTVGTLFLEFCVDDSNSGILGKC